MKIITISIAEKLMCLVQGEQVRGSLIPQFVGRELVYENIVQEIVSGSRHTFILADRPAFDNWLFNRYQINDLQAYIDVLKDDATGRAEQTVVSGNSKIKHKRTFKGFLINCYSPIACKFNGNTHIINPLPGIFQFIYEYEQFIPPADVVIVGMENAENFRFVEKQQQLFQNIKPLFISRYPQLQSSDALRWLVSIPNPYLHFGDFDFAGINIYLREYKTRLGNRATYFVPENIEQLIADYGNKNLYDTQELYDTEITEPGILKVIELIHKYKKGLEQEALINV